MWPFNNKQPEQHQRIMFNNQLPQVPPKEVRLLTDLVWAFKVFQYEDKHIAAQSLRTIAETCNRMAEDSKTFNRGEPTGSITVTTKDSQDNETLKYPHYFNKFPQDGDNTAR